MSVPGNVWRWWGLVALCWLLSGCQTPPQTLQLHAKPPAIARQHLIAEVPFYPQQDYFCGPTTLAEVAGFYALAQGSAAVSPETIAPRTFIPGLKGTLQIEMTAATRQLGLLAYTQRGSLQQLLSLVADNKPVIVLQNNGLSWWPQWHYAVVIGYDLDAGELILHTGVTASYRLDFATFERTWQRGQYWLLLMLPPGLSNAQLDPFLFTKASQELLSTQQVPAGLRALETATRQWPHFWLPYFLLGNHHSKQQPALAQQWFAAGLPAGRQQIAYLNNYALLQSAQGCHQHATELIGQALQIAPSDRNLLDSQQQIRAGASRAQAGAALAGTQCPQVLPAGDD